MSHNYQEDISIGVARMIAAAEAKIIIGSFAGNVEYVLAEDYIEADFCWMFFRHPDIDVPDSACLGIKWAFVVSKKGTFSMVQDLSYDRGLLMEYIKKLSDRFGERNE